jgi:hypothetical protein
MLARRDKAEISRFASREVNQMPARSPNRSGYDRTSGLWPAVILGLGLVLTIAWNVALFWILYLARPRWVQKSWYDYTGKRLEEMQRWQWQKVHHPEHVDNNKLRTQTH